MRATALLTALAFPLASLAFACERAEPPGAREPASVAPKEAAPAPPAPPLPPLLASAPPKEERGAVRCIQPLASPPPEPAKKAEKCPRDPEKNPVKLAKGKVSFPDAPAAPVLSVEIAKTPPEHERGLMYRTSLGSMRGMIFTWDDERLREFWMKNTCIPLDMLYLAKDGTVVGVLEQVPVMNQEPRAVHCRAAYVLEVNAGWARAHGVTPGMKASLSL